MWKRCFLPEILKPTWLECMIYNFKQLCYRDNKVKKESKVEMEHLEKGYLLCDMLKTD